MTSRSSVPATVLFVAILASTILLPTAFAPPSLLAAATEPDAAAADSVGLHLPPLDRGLASFGAAIAGDALYVYGGHVGGTHEHSVENLDHRFRRLDLLDAAAGWQDLGEVRGLQGLAMVAHGDRVCRIGGLDARNAKGADEDLVSIDEVKCYDPGNKTWLDLPSLPAGRSSHDAAMLGDHLYVAGGWQLRGRGEEPSWHDTLLVMDVSAERPEWRAVAQPFMRRALAVAAAGGRIHVLGGLGPDGTSLRSDIYDPAAGSWSQGPDLPVAEGPMRGFGVAAFGVGDRVLLSGGDGAIQALARGAEDWQHVGMLERSRFFHRLLPWRQHLLFVAGAQRGQHYADIEVVELGALQTSETASEGPSVTPPRRATVADRWPAFRGAGGGPLAASDLPLVRQGDQPVWQVQLPGFGQSAPVVWEGRVYVTSVEAATENPLILSAFDLDTGALHWRRRFSSSQAVADSDMYSRGAPTPVVDATTVYAFWETGDVIAVDPAGGGDRWRRSLTDDYGPFLGNHGVASSPLLVGDGLLLQVTHEGPSYFVALDRHSGEVLFKVDREAGVAWTTPVLATLPGAQSPVVISSAAGRVEAFDGATGSSLWRVDGMEKNHVPSVTVTDGWVIVASSAASANVGLRVDADGADIVWRAEGVSSGFASPVVHGECVMIVNKTGVLTCVSKQDGARLWNHRLPGAVWASPVVAGDRVSFVTKDGSLVTLLHSASGIEVLGETSLPVESSVYGVAAVRGALVVRTGDELLRLGSSAISMETTKTRPLSAAPALSSAR